VTNPSDLAPGTYIVNYMVDAEGRKHGEETWTQDRPNGGTMKRLNFYQGHQVGTQMITNTKSTGGRTFYLVKKDHYPRVGRVGLNGMSTQSDVDQNGKLLQNLKWYDPNVPNEIFSMQLNQHGQPIELSWEPNEVNKTSMKANFNHMTRELTLSGSAVKTVAIGRRTVSRRRTADGRKVLEVRFLNNNKRPAEPANDVEQPKPKESKVADAKVDKPDTDSDGSDTEEVKAVAECGVLGCATNGDSDSDDGDTEEVEFNVCVCECA
jgi:hypothetical protein